MKSTTRDDARIAPWSEDQARAVIAKHLAREDSLLVILHALQDAFGCVPEAAISLIANALNLSRAEIHGVVTFYRDFRRAPNGRHVLKLCRAEACQSMGGDELAECASRMLGLSFGETAEDGSISLEAVYCLGLCGCAPAALFDGRPVGRLDETTLSALVSRAKA